MIARFGGIAAPQVITFSYENKLFDVITMPCIHLEHQIAIHKFIVFIGRNLSS